MPRPERSHRLEKSVLFTVTGQDRYGEPTFSDPVEIMVRFNTVRRRVLDANGKQVDLDGMAVVGQKIDIGSLMYIGSLSYYLGTGSNVLDNELMVVKTYNETSDVKNRLSTKTVGLMRYKQKTS